MTGSLSNIIHLIFRRKNISLSINFLVPKLQSLKRKNCAQKVEKTTPKSCSEILNFFIIPYCPDLPNWPKQKNSCSKMWLINQLYIKLGLRLPNKRKIFQLSTSVENVYYLSSNEWTSTNFTINSGSKFSSFDDDMMVPMVPLLVLHIPCGQSMMEQWILARNPQPAGTQS